MKKLSSLNVIRIICLSMICGVFFSRCEKEKTSIVGDVKCPVETTIGKENDIVGKWKLVKSHSPMVNETTDYSCNNIVYNFRSDGSIHITRDVSQPELPEPRTYELIRKPYLENVMPLTLKIEQSELGCSISKESMIFNSAPLDGAIQTFARIK